MRRSALPLVVVCGATGTGKTKLAVELARSLRPPAPELLSADSMQVYKGLDIITAKPTLAERAAAPHHFVDILEPHQTFTVVDFRNKALKIIDNLLQNGKIPIMVGGTVYYLESIMWKILVEDEEDWDSLLCERDPHLSKRIRLEDFKERRNTEPSDDIEKDVSVSKQELSPTKDMKNEESNLHKEVNVNKIENQDIEGNNEIDKTAIAILYHEDNKYSNEEIHKMLQTVDPAMAAKLHPNNRRKVLRAIEVWLKTGRRHSEVLEDQAESDKQLRMKDSTIVFWLKCEQSVHDDRLDRRVNSMLDEGLVKELLDYHARYNQQRLKDGQSPDYTKGIFQTLGFKEFHEYLILSEEDRASEAGEKLLQEGVALLKLATKRFARKQNKMIRLRMLDHPFREIPPIYELDVTDLSKWDENVMNRALTIINSFLDNTTCPYQPLKPSDSVEEMKTADVHSNNTCEICNRLFIGDLQFRIHLKSKKHERMLKRLKKHSEAQLKLEKVAENTAGATEEK